MSLLKIVNAHHLICPTATVSITTQNVKVLVCRAAVAMKKLYSL